MNDTVVTLYEHGDRTEQAAFLRRLADVFEGQAANQRDQHRVARPRPCASYTNLPSSPPASPPPSTSDLWRMYAPDLRWWLSSLAELYPPEVIAEAAAALAELVAEHGGRR